MKNILIGAIVVVFGLSTHTYAEEAGNAAAPAKESKNLTSGQISGIIPGLGTVMLEYSHRFYIVYYAAKAGNWNLAAYELHEMLEIQEVAEATRPERAAALKAFEDSYLSKVEESVKAKEWKKFDTSYKKAVVGCNACHSASGHGYIRYKIPSTPPQLLDLSVK